MALPAMSEQVDAVPAGGGGWPMRIVTLAMLAVVAVQCLVPIWPDVYWDVDPRFEAGGATVAFGPAAYTWLNVLSIFIAGIAMWLHGRTGGTVRAGVCVLALLGALACAWHMPHDIENLRRGGGWVAAMALAVAAAHMAQHDDARRWIVAGLVGLLVPWAIGAIMWVTYEHGLTRELFDAQRELILEQRGWEAGSAQEQLYLRRMSGMEAFGSFGFANVFGSLAAAGAVIAGAIAIGLLKAGRRPHALLPACVALLGAVTALLTLSKGVYAALLLGMVLMGVLMLAPGLTARLGRRGLGVLAVALVSMAFCTVIARGLEGPPETVAGERSLYFRYQYWQGARAILGEQSWGGWLLGVGPGGFQDRYQQAKSPLSPEDIRSTHSVFVDWVTFLGAGGAAWSVLVLVMLTRAARAVGPPAHAVASPQAQPRSADLLCALALGGVVLGGEIMIKANTMTVERYLAWALSLIGFIIVVAMLVTPGWVTRRAAAVGLFVAGVMLLMHAQVEMTFFTEGAVALALLTLATASAWVPAERVVSQRGRYVPAMVLVLMGVLLMVFGAVPLTRQQAAMARAAESLRAGDVAACEAHLARAGMLLPSDPQPYLQRARLSAGRAEGLARGGDLDAARKAAAQAVAALDDAAAAGVERTAHVRLRAQTLERLAAATGDSAVWRDAAAAWQRVIESNPHEPRDRVRLADVLWRTGDYKAAAEAYRAAIESSRLLYLDPARQLPDEAITRAQNRIAATETP